MTNSIRQPADQILNSEHGITLVVAVVLLAAVSLASFTLSSIVIREVKTASLIQDSSPAIVGAYSGGEVGLYHLQRAISGVNMSNQSLSAGGAMFDVVADLTDDPLILAVSSAQDSSINLYNVEDFEALDTGIRRIVVTNVSGQPIKADVYSWGDASSVICGTDNLPASSFQNCPSLAGPDYRYYINIHVNGNGNSIVSIQAFNGSGNSIGLPSPSPTIEAAGRLGQTNHRIRINLGN